MIEKFDFFTIDGPNRPLCVMRTGSIFDVRRCHVALDICWNKLVQWQEWGRGRGNRTKNLKLWLYAFEG